MNTLHFELKPFPSEQTPLPADVKGAISRAPGRLAVTFSLSGSIETVEIPGPATEPRQLDRLWESTCFELFLTTPHSRQYWEFNLSPASHWNVYHFDEYRQGMREETFFKVLPFNIAHTYSLLNISIDFPVSPLIPDDMPIQTGIASVLRASDGKIEYRALAHTGTGPDFHRRDSFILTLDPPAWRHFASRPGTFDEGPLSP